MQWAPPAQVRVLQVTIRNLVFLLLFCCSVADIACLFRLFSISLVLFCLLLVMHSLHSENKL